MFTSFSGHTYIFSFPSQVSLRPNPLHSQYLGIDHNFHWAQFQYNIYPWLDAMSGWKHPKLLLATRLALHSASNSSEQSTDASGFYMWKSDERLLTTLDAVVNKILRRSRCWSSASYRPWRFTVKKDYMASGSTSETEWNIEYNLHWWKKFRRMYKNKK